MIGQLNPTQLSSKLASMSDEQLRQYATLHQNDPYVLAIASDVANQRAATRQATVPPQTPQNTVVQQLISRMAQLPVVQGSQGQQMPTQQAAPQQSAPQQAAPQQAATSGIANLPAQNIARMKEGGIAGYAAGDVTKSDPKQAFALQYKDLAEQVGAELGVDPGLIIAQWGLETGWGSKTVGQYNFGNIKDPTGKGPRAKDVAEGSYDSYRQYNSPAEFAADYVAQMKRNWPGALGAGSDPVKFAEGLKNGRLGAYATAPNYGAVLANTFNSLVPSAQAAPAPPQTQARPSPGKRFPTPEEMAAIRGGVPLLANSDIELPPSARPAAASEKPSVSPLQHVLGAGETLLTLGSGTVAPFVGAVKSGTQRLVGSPVDEAQFHRNVESSIYTPRTEAGRQQVEGIAKVAEELKIPPYIPTIGGVSGAARAARAAQEAERAAANAAAASAKVAAPRLTPPAAAATTPARERSLAAARQAEFQSDQAAARTAQTQAADAAQAAAARRTGVQRQQADMAYAQGAAQRAGLAGIAGMGAQTVAAANAPVAAATAAPRAEMPRAPRQISETERNAMLEANASPATAAASVAVAEKALSPEQRKGMSWEDLMMFGFALMAGQSPYALQNVGAAGIAALQGKQAREKAEREQAQSASKARQEEAMAKYYEAYAGAIERGAKEKNDVVAAETLVQKRMADWEKANKVLLLSNPNAGAAEEARIRREIYGQLGLEVARIPGAPAAADTSGFKVVGVRNP